jgi:hypothetical protein
MFLFCSMIGVNLDEESQGAIRMTMQTHFIVQTFRQTNRGALAALPPIAALDAAHALRLVSQHKNIAAGVIAFSRRGDPETGDYEEAVVLSVWGRVPESEALAVPQPEGCQRALRLPTIRWQTGQSTRDSVKSRAG